MQFVRRWLVPVVIVGLLVVMAVCGGCDFG
jgi:hypothetical protein